MSLESPGVTGQYFQNSDIPITNYGQFPLSYTVWGYGGVSPEATAIDVQVEGNSSNYIITRIDAAGGSLFVDFNGSTAHNFPPLWVGGS